MKQILLAVVAVVALAWFAVPAQAHGGSYGYRYGCSPSYGYQSYYRPYYPSYRYQSYRYSYPSYRHHYYHPHSGFHYQGRNFSFHYGY
jgi:hypothetical protein